MNVNFDFEKKKKIFAQAKIGIFLLDLNIQVKRNEEQR